MSFLLPAPNGEVAQLEILSKNQHERYYYVFLVGHFSMWHERLTVRGVTLWSRRCPFEYVEQLVRRKADISPVTLPFKCS